jgi:hypothetical protein
MHSNWDNSRLGNGIQSIGVFVALFAAIIALSAADPEKLSVKFEIEHYVEKDDIAEYDKGKLSIETGKFYEGYPDPFKSYKVNFKIINTSGFTWKHPTLTFRLLISNLHPKDDYSWQAFNSKIYNSSEDFRRLLFQDTLVLSNNNLPYWNDKENITFWIRMATHKDLRPSIVVSVNCDNAEGVNQEVKVELKEQK